ncbi:MAG: energy transducer TonB [Myxococcales bacterium]|nr:energy transducer TonB [Myxococcales bacterium]
MDEDMMIDEEALRIADEVPEAWLAAAAGEGSLDGLGEGAGIAGDDTALRELLRPLDLSTEARIADRAVAAYLEEEAASPAFAVDEPLAITEIPRIAAVAESRRWWRIGLPLAAAAILVIVVLDRPLGDEMRVSASELAGADGGGERATPGAWPKTVAPGRGVMRSEVPDEAEPEEDEAEVPGARPGAGAGAGAGAGSRVVELPGGVAGGVVGGVVGGQVGAVRTEPVGPVEAPLARSEPPPQRPLGPITGVPMTIEAVMAQGIYTPDPDPKALTATTAGLFERRACTSKIAFCVQPQGRTLEVRTTGSCDDPEVDEICRRAVRSWRFRPFVVDGKATTVCTEVAFDLRFGKR